MISPLTLLLAATAAGVAIDRELGPASTATWLASALVAVTIGCLFLRSPRLSASAVLCATATFAGGWHHHLWNDLEPDDIAPGMGDRPAPAWVRGMITETNGLRRGEGFTPGDPGRITTRMVLDLQEISDGARWRPARGRASTIVAGDRSDLHPGEPVEAAGQLSRIAGPLNPGEFDYRSFQRARGILLRLQVDSPEGIFVDPSRPVWPGTWWLGKIRERCRARLLAQLDPHTAPLAAALILGQREDIAPEVDDAFARTGTTHLLAISGLQLQALALALIWIFRCAGLPRRLAYGTVALSTVGYAVLVGLAPSVVRSAVMTVTFCLAAIASRPTRPANMLALAGLVTLWWNPFFLYDVGCQLSFLAIAVLIWLVPLAREGVEELTSLVSSAIHGPDTPIEELRRAFEPSWHRAVRWAWRKLRLGILASLIVWLAALPLVAARFHLVSPIGVLLNIPLIPLTDAALLLGAAGMAAGLVWSAAAAPLILATDMLLKVSEMIVRWGVAQPWGHRFVAGPGWGSVAAFYLLLGLATVLTLAGTAGTRPVLNSRLRRLAPWIAVGASVIPGWLISGPPPGGPSLEADILAVGHGLSVALHTPDGSTMLYDCGKMGDPGVGRRIIAPALWSRGVNRLDTIYLSHADQDHYNGLRDLLDRFRIDQVAIPPGFASDQNPEAAALLREVTARGIPVRTIAAPAHWSRGGVEFRVLHPPEGWYPESPDNARSLVMDIAHEGRHLLLTGDLDGIGLVALAEQPRPGSVDLMLAPHHGGRSANPPWLYSWARPRAVVVSQRPSASGAADALSPLERSGIPLLRTWDRGAVHLRWLPDRITTEGFLDHREEPGRR